MRTRHDKLIRDRIPEIMEGEGVRYEVTELNDEAYRQALLSKVIEEAQEVAGSDGIGALIEEIADLHEVLEALMRHTGIAPQRVRHVKQQRRMERGGFERKLALRWTERESRAE